MTSPPDAPVPLADLRKEYERHGLLESDASLDPIEQFQRWFGEAARAGVHEPNAMTLATATPDGVPSARIVLLKGVDAEGFVFFTNYESTKGSELGNNPRAALVFFWPELERQVRIKGVVARVTAVESDAYFASRPLGSRLGAWASKQSSPVDGRSTLEAALAATEARFAGGEVPRPPHWGGYRLRPSAIELWQGRPNRLHDRLLYTRNSDGAWTRARLSP